MTVHPNDRDWDHLDALVDEDPIALRDAAWRLAVALDQAEATLAAIKARDEEVSTDEGWWIGGAWGDYGEVVVPLRILSYVVGGELDQKVTETSPGYALTYAEQVARADQAEAERDHARARMNRVRALLVGHGVADSDVLLEQIDGALGW